MVFNCVTNILAYSGIFWHILAIFGTPDLRPIYICHGARCHHAHSPRLGFSLHDECFLDATPVAQVFLCMMAFGASGDLGPEAFLVGSVSSDSIASGIAQLEGCIRKHHAFHCVSLCFCLFHMLGLRSIIWGVAMHCPRRDIPAPPKGAGCLHKVFLQALAFS